MLSQLTNWKRKMSKSASLAALKKLVDSIQSLKESGWSQSDLEAIVVNEYKLYSTRSLLCTQWELPISSN